MIPEHQPRQRDVRTLIPVEKDTDPATLRWLAAESIHRTVYNDSMDVVGYCERQLTTAEAEAMIREQGGRPDQVEQALGGPLDSFDWWLFEAVARTDVQLINWMIAEGQWRNQQIAQWLDAETRWTAAQHA